MKTRTILLLLIMTIILPSVSFAQFGAVRRAINRQIDHKIDSAIDKSAQDERDKKAKEDSAANKSAGTNATENTAPRNKNVGLFGGKIDIRYKDNYNFTGRIYMQMENYDKKDVIRSDFYTYFNPDSRDAGIDLQTTDPKQGDNVIMTSFIFDSENRAFMSLLDTQSKIGTISSIPTDSAIAAQAKARGDKAKQPVVTKTGNTRVIAGYKCEEYKVVDPEREGYSLVWMTKDFKVKSDTRYWGKSGSNNYYNYPGFEGAVMLAMQEFDKKNELTTRMETKEIDEHFNHSMSTVGYTFSKINFGQGRR